MITSDINLFQDDYAEQLLQDRMGMLDRAGQRLERFIVELKEIGEELDRLEHALNDDALSDIERDNILYELDLSVHAHNHLREAAVVAYQQILLQREACGFRNHDVVRRCYPLPEERLPPGSCEYID